MKWGKPQDQFLEFWERKEKTWFSL
jgi:hypothetical protein